MTPPIDIRADHLRIVQDVLHRHLPHGVKVWVFGSRASWMTKDSSDLDLALEGDTSIAPRLLSALETAFEESDLPFPVDIVDVKRISERFRRIVEQQRVPLPERDRLHSTHKRESSRGEWLDGTLADACSAIDYGLTASASNQASGLRFLRISDIVSGQIDWSTVPYVAVDDITAEKYGLHDGDVVLARTGASTGVSAYVKNPPHAVFASYLVRLRARPGFDGRFLAYYLKSDQFQQYIRGVLGDKSAQPNASASTMTAAPLRAPRDTTEQHAITHILGTLDDKIELNRRMNTTLEAMARALFRSWFVDFDPVRAKMEGRDLGLPKGIADLFPDRLVESELGEIPEGWAVVPLTELLEVNPKRSLQKRQVAPYLDMSNMPTKGHVPNSVVDRPFGSGMRFVNGDTLIARITPCLENGKTAYVDFLHNDEVGWGSTEYLVLRPKPPLPEQFAYCLARSARFREFAVQNMSGTSGRQRVPPAALSGFSMTSPPAQLATEFGDIAQSLFERASRAVLESRTLAELRDALLPKLVSGELRVDVPEATFELDRPVVPGAGEAHDT